MSAKGLSNPKNLGEFLKEISFQKRLVEKIVEFRKKQTEIFISSL